MREPQPAAASAASPLDWLNVVWYSVLKPSPLIVAGQPGLQAVHQCQTLAEATAYVSQVPGGLIVANLVVFVNPRLTAPAAAKQ
jgi:hypothetical protein